MSGGSRDDPLAGMELCHLDDAFQRFLRSVDDDRLWFCFFGPGLLHVFRHFTRFLPAELNCALLTTALTADERALLREITPLPVFHVPGLVDSKAVYELLFRNCARPFGWVDVDCFVARGGWFAECAAGAGPGIAACGPFLYGPIPLLAAPMMCFNPDAMHDIVSATGGLVSPASYAYRRTAEGREAPGFTCRVVQEHHEEALRRVLVMESPGIPFPQGGVLDRFDDGSEARSHERHHHRELGRRLEFVVFDGLMMYQLMARAAGQRIGQFRRYAGSKVMSAEVVHTGGISYWERLSPHNAQVSGAPGSRLPWSAHLDAVLLGRFLRERDLPDAYRERADRLAGRLAGAGVTMDALRDELARELRSRGVDSADERWAEALGDP